MKNLFQPLWTRQAKEDPDYQVALWGLRAGQIFDGEVQINTEQFPDQIDELLAIQGWQEKGEELSPEELSHLDIKQIMDNFTPSEEYIENFKPKLDRLLGKVPPKPKSKQQPKKPTGLKRVPWFVGKGLQKVGRVIQTYSE